MKKHPQTVMRMALTQQEVESLQRDKKESLRLIRDYKRKRMHEETARQSEQEAGGRVRPPPGGPVS